VDISLEGCDGGDRDKDGVRDTAWHVNDIAMMSVNCGVASSFLGDFWCLQLVIERLLAFQEAFGETLPCAKATLYLSRFLKVSILLIPAAAALSLLANMVLTTIIALGMVILVVLICLAYLLPLQVLRSARKVDSEQAMGRELSKETCFAMKVILAAQVGSLLAGLSMAIYFSFYGVFPLLRTPSVTNAFEYSGMADTVGNSLCLALLSGSSLSLPKWSKWSRPPSGRSQSEAGSGNGKDCSCGKQLGKTWSDALALSSTSPTDNLCEACAWEMKVSELASRRISVDQLLNFYRQLGQLAPTAPTTPSASVIGSSESLASSAGHRSLDWMPHFQPEKSTTNDVVRHAMIPASRRGQLGVALCEVLRPGSGRRVSVLTKDHAPRMVTHHWGNRFCHLVAAVTADALQLTRWDNVAQQLASGEVDALRRRLHDDGLQDIQYWICAICINQHASICGNSMGVRDTVTGDVLPSCDCVTPKFFNDHPIQCELNKFDCMMKQLHLRYSQNFLQVVAIDEDFHMFSRAWCVAELVEAYNSHMDQHVMLHSPTVLEQNSSRLSSLKVENCAASRPEDKEAILSKIGEEDEIATFNRRLQQLLLGSKGLLAGWLDGQKLLQEVGAIAARARARVEGVPQEGSQDGHDVEV